MNKNFKILTIFALHTSNRQKLHSTVNNVSYFIKYSQKIVCVDSIECKNSDLENELLNLYPNINFSY